MAQPTTFTRERIVGAAFELTREAGWPAVTVRSIAKRLGSSTMPIYSHLRSIEEVEGAVRSRARALLVDYQQRAWTPEALMNLAFGYIAFARDEANLFRFLFIERPDVVGEKGMGNMRASFDEQFGADGAEAAALGALDPSAQAALIQHSWIFTHGLAVLVNAGSLRDCSDETILRLLNNAGEAFYLWAAGMATADPAGQGRGATDSRASEENDTNEWRSDDEQD
ncbi:MAG: TetR/AcrR family transcriptional regulator [Spirochaetaceae bacterium]